MSNMSDEKIDYTTIEMLKNKLDRINIDHKSEIIKENSFKKACVYCVKNDISAQQYGPFLENYIIKKFCFYKNNASDCNGDCSKLNKNFEIKVSLGGKEYNSYNFVQIRLSHNIDYYIFTAYNLSYENVDSLGESYIFLLEKKDVINMISKYGQYAHGTKSKLGHITPESINNEANKDFEYCLRTKIGAKCWNELLKYRIEENEL